MTGVYTNKAPALRPSGVRHADMPLTPAQVWRAIQGRPFRTDLAIGTEDKLPS